MSTLNQFFQDLYTAESAQIDNQSFEHLLAVYDYSIEATLAEIHRTFQVLDSLESLNQAHGLGTLSTEGYELAATQVFQMAGLDQTLSRTAASWEADDKSGDVKEGRIKKAINWILAQLKRLWEFLTGKKKTLAAKVDGIKRQAEELKTEVAKADATIKSEGGAVNTETGAILIGPIAKEKAKEDPKVVEVKSFPEAVKEVEKVEKKDKERMKIVKVMRSSVDPKTNEFEYSRFVDSLKIHDEIDSILSKSFNESTWTGTIKIDLETLRQLNQKLDPESHQLVDGRIPLYLIGNIPGADSTKLYKKHYKLDTMLTRYINKLDDKRTTDVERNAAVENIRILNEVGQVMQNFYKVLDLRHKTLTNIYFAYLKYAKKIE